MGERGQFSLKDTLSVAQKVDKIEVNHPQSHSSTGPDQSVAKRKAMDKQRADNCKPKAQKDTLPKVEATELHQSHGTDTGTNRAESLPQTKYQIGSFSYPFLLILALAYFTQRLIQYLFQDQK